MANTFRLNVLTPDKSLISEEVAEAVFSTPQGRIGIMAGHMPLVAAVSECMLEISLTDGSWKTAAISQGFAEIQGNTAEFFVDTAEWADEIDTARAKESLDRAQLRLQGELNQIQYMRTRASIARALSRLKAAERAKE